MFDSRLKRKYVSRPPLLRGALRRVMNLTCFPSLTVSSSEGSRPGLPAPAARGFRRSRKKVIYSPAASLSRTFLRKFPFQLPRPACARRSPTIPLPLRAAPSSEGLAIIPRRAAIASPFLKNLILFFTFFLKAQVRKVPFTLSCEVLETWFLLLGISSNK